MRVFLTAGLPWEIMGILWAGSTGLVGVCTHRLLAAALPPSAFSARLGTFHYSCSDSSSISGPTRAAPNLLICRFDVTPVRVYCSRIMAKVTRFDRGEDAEKHAGGGVLLRDGKRV